jgi:hypothetical protein
MSLNQVDDAIGDASRLGDQQDCLLSVELADHEKLSSAMHLKSRKPCTRGDQIVNGIKISLQVDELAAYCGLDLPSAWLLLFGNTEEDGTCLTTIVSGLVLANI